LLIILFIATVKVADAERVLLKVTVLESNEVNVADADNVLFIVVILRTNEGVNANDAERVTNFDFNEASDTVDARFTENDLNIEVIVLPSVAVNVSGAPIALFNVVILLARDGVNVALAASVLNPCLIIETVKVTDADNV